MLYLSYTREDEGESMFRVLLVDDEQIILDGLSNLISWEEFGFSEIGLATGVPQALEDDEKNAL